MNHKTLSSLVKCIAPLLVVLGVLATPGEAHAQFRLGAYAGVERISGGGSSTTLFMARAEGTVGFIPWLQAGLYAETLSGFDKQKTGWGVGALATLRPSIPGTSIDPMGYASIGYQRAPANAVFNSGALIEVGGGLVWHMTSILDLELRGGYVGLLGDNKMHGFSAALGLSLHP